MEEVELFKKKEIIYYMEKPLEKSWKVEYGLTIDEMLEMRQKEEILLQEKKGNYPDWKKLSDHGLISSLLSLRDIERRLIYQHVFEEKTFEEIAYLNGMPMKSVKNIYYYAIQKIRNWMGGER